MIDYKEKDLSGGWSIAVILKGTTIGHIRKHGQEGGGFVYYEGQNNQLNWSLQDHDLSALKTKIEKSPR